MSDIDISKIRFKHSAEELAEIARNYKPNFNKFKFVSREGADKIWYGRPTNEIEFEIWLRSRLDPIWFIDNITYVKPGDNFEYSPLYEPQRDVLRLQNEYWYIQVLKSRQTGISTTTRRYIAWGFLFFPAWTAIVVSKTGDDAKDYLRGLKEIIHNISIRHPYLVPKIKNWQATSIGNEAGSRVVATTTTSNTARGMTSQFVVLDEAAFSSEFGNLYKAISLTLTVPLSKRIKERAEAPELPKHLVQQGVREIPKAPFGMVIVSTPNKKRGAGRWFYETWVRNEERFAQYLHDLEKYEQGKLPDKPKKPLFAVRRIHWSEYPDFGEEWYKAQCEILNNNPLDIRQELELEFIDDGADIFPPSFFEQYVVKEPIRIEYKIDGYPEYGLYIFKEPEPNGVYIAGVDCATGDTIGDNPDRHAMVVIDLYGNTCAEYLGAYIDQTELARIVHEVGTYYNNALVIVERNMGTTVIAHLLDGIITADKIYDAYVNLYKYIDVTKSKNRVKKDVYGFPTSSKTRGPIAHDCYTDILSNPGKLYSERFLDELKDLTIVNGSIRAYDGGHDDIFMARALALRARRDVYKIFVGYDSAKIEEALRVHNTPIYEPMFYMNLPEDERQYVQELLESARERGEQINADTLTMMLDYYREIKKHRRF